MIKMLDIGVVAGLLEGEGSFVINNKTCPRICMGMKDVDVVRKVRDIMSPNSTISIRKDRRNSHRSDIYYFSVNGCKAVQWMMTVYSLMGDRRKEQIKSVLVVWKSTRRNVNKLRVVA